MTIRDNSACVGLRRRLGATAWFVLEELVIRAALEPDGSLHVQVSTRELAASLELNKDTVTRALAKLRAASGVAVATRGGATGPSVLVVDVPAALVVAPHVVAADAVEARVKRRGSRSDGGSSRDAKDTQLSLLS